MRAFTSLNKNTQAEWIISDNSPNVVPIIAEPAEPSVIFPQLDIPVRRFVSCDDRVPRGGVAYLGHRRFRHQFEPVMRQVQLTT